MKYALMIAALLMSSNAMAQDAKHFYFWLPFENFPTPSPDATVKMLLHDVELRLIDPNPNVDVIIDILSRAQAFEAANDHTPQPVGMFDDPSVNQQVIGQISVTIEALKRNDVPSANGFLANATVGGDYKQCYLHTPADCIPPDPHS